jgi:hypothetical protein
LASSPTEKNALEFVLENVTDREVGLGIQVSVGDPVKADWGSQEVSPLTKSAGSFAELEVSVKPSHPTVVRIPFSIPPDAGQTPLLVFRIFLRLDRPSPDLAERLRFEEWAISSLCCGNLVYAGSIDLHEAASTGKVLLPPHVPAAERSKLTVEKRSKHFVFRYRPDSFAEGNIERIIQEREAAYDKAHAMLQMDVPVTVAIDLYTDLEAKALGSRTEWTPHNTLNNRHIAEVCNDSCECDASHELAHIFTYHMGGATGGLCEPFAVYCENDTDIANATERVRRKLKQGSLKPLEETLSIPSDETIAFIDYLLTGHLSKFKRFYVQTTKVTNWDELNGASREIYGMDLKTLERCWRTSVRDAPRYRPGLFMESQLDFGATKNRSQPPNRIDPMLFEHVPHGLVRTAGCGGY